MASSNQFLVVDPSLVALSTVSIEEADEFRKENPTFVIAEVVMPSDRRRAMLSSSLTPLVIYQPPQESEE